MNYHNITWCDMSNGRGTRVVLWLSGCQHKCKGCHNPQTWDPNSGIYFDDDAKKELFEYLSMPEHDGITFSGGDPLSIFTREDVTDLMKEIKEKFPEKDIWCYTGYLYEDVKNLEAMKYIDILVDGKYEEEHSNPSPKWRGSYNQRIIRVHYTRLLREVILDDDNDLEEV